MRKAAIVNRRVCEPGFNYSNIFVVLIYATYWLLTTGLRLGLFCGVLARQPCRCYLRLDKAVSHSAEAQPARRPRTHVKMGLVELKY